MKRLNLALAVLLIYAVLTLWIEQPWAWGLFQIAIFSISAWRFAWLGRIPHCRALIPLACASIWPLMQIALGVSLAPAATLGEAWKWLTFLLVCALACEIGSDRVELRGFLRILVVFAMILAAVSAIQQVSSGEKIFWIFPSGYPDGVLGPFVNRNQYSAWVELLLPMALYLAARRSRFRGLYVSAAAILYGSVVAGESRAGFVLATGEVAVAIAVLTCRGLLPRKILLQFAVFALVAILVAGWQGLLARFQNPAGEALRLDALKASLHMAQDRPGMGAGLGSWSQIYPRYAGIDTGLFVNQAHNDWAQWAAEGGIPFFAFLVIFAALCCKPAFRSIYGLGVVVFLMHALVDYPMQQRPGLGAWFFAVAGIALAQGNASTREH